MLPSSFLFLATTLPLASAQAQSLLQAIGNISSLSNFTAFYRANEISANLLFNNPSSWPITVLVPNNQAFAAYFQKTNRSLANLSPQELLPLIQYHSLVSSLGAENFTAPSDGAGSGIGTTVPTLLAEGPSNNRTAGAALASKFGGVDRAKGQVVFIRPSASTSNTKRFILSNRQNPGPSSSIRSGLQTNVNVQVIDPQQGTWAGGRFHVIDGLLTLPDLCSKTIRGAGLTGLDNALNRSSLWPTLDSSTNVTCLGPSNEAFRSAGNPDGTLNATQLQSALLFHTLPEVAYSDYLTNGQEFTSIQGAKVKVKIEGTGSNRVIYFNNAKLIEANVLTNNGLMHIIDGVMSPNGTPSATPSSTPSSTTSRGTASATNSKAAAPNFADGYIGWNAVHMLGFLILADIMGLGALGLRF